MKSKLKHSLTQYQIKGSDEEHSHVLTTTVKARKQIFHCNRTGSPTLGAIAVVPDTSVWS